MRDDMSQKMLLWPAFVDLMGNIAIVLMFILAFTIARGRSLEGQIIEGLGDQGLEHHMDLTVEIERLNAALLASDERARLAEAQIVELGTRLNRALAHRAAELHRQQVDPRSALATRISDAIERILAEEGL